MRWTKRLTQRMKRVLDRPGAAVDLEPLRTLVPQVQEQVSDLREHSDEELTELAVELRARVSGIDDADDGDDDAGNAGHDDTDHAGHDDTDHAGHDDTDHAGHDDTGIDDGDNGDTPAGGSSEQSAERPGKESGTPEGTSNTASESAARLDDITLVEATALAAEAARRGVGEEPYETQILGAIAMNSGHVAEMATGEGKTLAAVLAAYGLGLTGERVHVLTANDYLAHRDAEWMRPAYELLGLTVGSITEASTPEERRAAYGRDVTYLTVNEAGFDLLRDQLCTDAADLVQPSLPAAIVDEADSILIDEARVPLVLAGERAHPTDPVQVADVIARDLKEGEHYEPAADGRTVHLSPAGISAAEKVLAGWRASAAVAAAVAEAADEDDEDEDDDEEDRDAIDRDEADQEELEAGVDQDADDQDADDQSDDEQDDDEQSDDDQSDAAADEAVEPVNLYDAEHVDVLTALNVALHARVLLKRDVDYIVRDGQVKLVDEFRGRVAEERRWPDGLQAAVEAKEGLSATAEGEILGTVTVQAFARLYRRLAGMTGTAVPVAEQLREFYGLEVAVIPPNRPRIREDEPVRIYRDAKAKEAAILAEVKEAHESGRPVLIGTLDVAESERLAEQLRENDVECAVLNAKNDEHEASLIADAGRRGAVTVSTQMAGRGVDIRLGGAFDGEPDEDVADEVAELGGLYVLGYGMHESQRVDDQLRGRAGRQGEPGGSAFFVSLEDDLVQRNAADDLPRKLRADEDGRVAGQDIERVVEHAQKVSEGNAAELHRNTWRYNEVVERQRVLLSERRVELRDTDAAVELVRERAAERYDDVVEQLDEDRAAEGARQVALFQLDRCWADHLAVLDELREGIYLRSLARLDPLQEFRKEAIDGFTELLDEADARTVKMFEQVEVTEDGLDLEGAGLIRPSATWTYLVQENPFGTEGERLLGAVRKFFRGAPRSDD